MSYDLGAVVPLSVNVKNSAGVLVNADTITLTITLPAGTTSTPTVANPPSSTGAYGYDYTSANVGRHTVAWTTTNPVTAYTDVFYVRSSTSLALCSLADMKAHLNMSASDTTYDAELRDAMDCATDVIEGIVGPVARRTVTETHSGRGTSAICLREPPVIDITSVTENGTAVAASGISLSAVSGVLYRVSGYSDSAWCTGRNNITVVYVVGRAGAIPGSILDSYRELVRINFRPQLGGNYSPFDGGAVDDQAGTVRLGFFVPNRILQVLTAHGHGPSVA